MGETEHKAGEESMQAELNAMKQAGPQLFEGCVDAPKPQYEDPYDDPAYQQFVEEMAKDCKCTPLSNRPCDGLLAGGLCDDLHTDRECDDYERDEDND